MRPRPIFVLVLILLAAAAAGVFVHPQVLGNKALPWRLGLDLVGGTHLVYEIDMSQVTDADKESVINGLRDVIERRVNLFGVSEPQVVTAKSGDSQRLIVELAGIKDVKEAIKEIGLTPFLYFAEVADDKEGKLKFTKTELTGRYIKSAQLNFNQVGRPEVLLSFDSEGARLFEQITERNVGRRIAVFLDNEPVTVPVVNQKITGGRAVITGDFTLDAARQMVERFNAGALPAPITLVSQQTVDASLGGDALKKTIFAGLVGTLVIMAFMIIYYRAFGFFAAAALIIYIALTLAVFKGLTITMTLAGIAGFLLSIGMAVDANILIFERSKEEIRRGLSRLSAIEEGFKRAWPSIRDSNITTIITAVILYYFTSSFVRGFALALLIGVLVSMFSAITVTRTLLRTFIKR